MSDLIRRDAILKVLDNEKYTWQDYDEMENVLNSIPAVRLGFDLTQEERLGICDMGYYNDVMKGYLVEAMKNAAFSYEEIRRALKGLHLALDEMNAKEALAVYFKE